MSKFIEMHILQNVGPGALNCNDLGAPKSVSFGPKDNRYRFSSQALTRTVKDEISKPYGNESFIDYSSKVNHLEISKLLKEKYNFSEEDAAILAKDAYRKVFENETNIKRKERKTAEKKAEEKALKKAKEKAEKDGKPIGDIKAEEQKHTMTLISKYEIEEVASKIKEKYDELDDNKKNLDKVIDKLKIKKDDFFNAGLKASMFGRMFASVPTAHVSATIQRSQAFTTHSVEIGENLDFFTAMDELIEDNTGSGHMGEKMFSCGCYYKNFVISVDELMDENHLGSIVKNNPNFDPYELLKNIIKEFAIALPNGKNNSFFSKSIPSYLLLNVVENSQPVSYATAFDSPVKKDEKVMLNSINRLKESHKNNSQWSNYTFSGSWTETSFNTETEEGDSIQKYDIVNKLIEDVVKKSK